ncbi:MAG: DNA repair protein RecO [Patescibacteria group bacterium]
MYNIYQTDGIILGGFNQREANRFFYIFSENLGLIKATAQSARELKSKLRYGLQDFALSRFSLARGQGVWRITNVEFKDSLYYSFRNDKKKLCIVANILILLKKLLAGEKRNEKLYQIIIQAFAFLEQAELSAKNIQNFENIILTRILHNLGYFDEKKKEKDAMIYRGFLQTSDWNEDLLKKMDDIKTQAILEINESLRLTNLF